MSLRYDHSPIRNRRVYFDEAWVLMYRLFINEFIFIDELIDFYLR